MTTESVGQPSPSLSLQLRERTRESHERIEGALNLLQPGLKMEQYAQLLERWYGFEKTWSSLGPQVLEKHLNAVYFAARHRLLMLRHDLLFLGRTEEQIAALPTVPADALPWHSPSGALGVLYVIEGSTLGGQHVAKFIREHLGLTPEHGLAYFSSYGADVGRRWRETKSKLDSAPASVDENEVVDAAIATFNYLGGWLTTPQ